MTASCLCVLTRSSESREKSHTYNLPVHHQQHHNETRILAIFTAVRLPTTNTTCGYLTRDRARHTADRCVRVCVYIKINHNAQQQSGWLLPPVRYVHVVQQSSTPAVSQSSTHSWGWWGGRSGPMQMYSVHQQCVQTIQMT